MIKSRTSREESLFEAARQLSDPIRRLDFLENACGEDEGLMARVQKLLEASVQADQFFSGCAPALLRISEPGKTTETRSTKLASRAALAIEEQLSSRIGPYKLLQKIGEGGCG